MPDLDVSSQQGVFFIARPSTDDLEALDVVA
jgi:hypothetical protein